MKAIIEFDLDGQQDRVAHLRAVKALDLALALWDMDQYLRGLLKHAPDDMSSEVYGTLQETRDKLHEIMSSYNIDLDELIL